MIWRQLHNQTGVHLFTELLQVDETVQVVDRR